MQTLTKIFLDRLVARLENENTLGIALSGSHARAEQRQFSDVDIRQYMREQTQASADSQKLFLVDGILISLTVECLEEAYASLRNPKRAIWAIPGLRQMRILLDKQAELARLKETAAKTSWQSLQKAANMIASRELCDYAEEINKILSGLAGQDESKTLYGVWGLTHGMAQVLLMQKGALVESENDFIALVQQTAGRNSTWTQHFRQATGLDPLAQDQPAYIGYGLASLKLYKESVRLMKDILLTEDAQVVDRTIASITEAGYLWN